jgi:hypothetical protein
MPAEGGRGTLPSDATAGGDCRASGRDISGRDIDEAGGREAFERGLFLGAERTSP